MKEDTPLDIQHRRDDADEVGSMTCARRERELTVVARCAYARRVLEATPEYRDVRA